MIRENNVLSIFPDRCLDRILPYYIGARFIRIFRRRGCEKSRPLFPHKTTPSPSDRPLGFPPSPFFLGRVKQRLPATPDLRSLPDPFSLHRRPALQTFPRPLGQVASAPLFYPKPLRRLSQDPFSLSPVKHRLPDFPATAFCPPPFLVNRSVWLISLFHNGR